MDRSWMQAHRFSDEYKNGVQEFLYFCDKNKEKVINKKSGFFYCPCVNCNNLHELTLDMINKHLEVNGICQNYTEWIWHGEKTHYNPVAEPDHHNEEVDMDDRMEEMIRDVGQDSFERAHMFDTLISDNERPLYPGCTKFTRLSAVLGLFNLKALNGWTDKSFTDLLQLLKIMLPKDNTLPDRNYEAKKILCPMGVAYKKIHACPKDCILYWKENEDREKCPVCKTRRYKKKDGDDSDEDKKGPPAKVLWYMPIIPRFKRLFANANDAENIRWHATNRKRDGMLRHPADSPQWEKIDSMFPEFGKDPRNLRLALATDGMNPFGNLSSQHSSWPVLLVIYNLSPWLCMKRKYMMLSMMISGPKQPGNDIDVYLQPLIEDLRKLWEEGVEVFDGFVKENFNLRAMLFCTINDFPAYGNLAGYGVKGHKACPVCMDDTFYNQLKHGRKTVYLGHRRFLAHDHPYRRHKKAFNGRQEFGIALKALSGEQIYTQVKDINVEFGKKDKKKFTQKNKWKKRSVFFDLPYWSKLDVRHCLDVMHVEKNVCDSVIGTLLNIQGKTKDGLNSRLDMLAMGIRVDLSPREKGSKKNWLPPACHTLSKAEKTSFCECLRGVKVPQGYSSNIRSLVSMQDLKLIGLKSHDCHVLMQQLLPVAIRGILPKRVQDALTRLCLFFNAVCCKVIDPQNLDELENEAVVVLCQLEMYFPPSFFDIMVHLIVHIVREIRECGPVYLRWMYPVERYMKILKGYVKNYYRPEASMVERYVTEEAVEFCTEYLSHAEPVGLPRSRHEGRVEGKGTRGFNVKNMAREDVFQAHLYVLNNTAVVGPYLDRHKLEIKTKHPRENENWVIKEHNKTFLKWFEEQVISDVSASETLKWLAFKPSYNVHTWTGYDVNKFSFYTKSQDDKSTVQNSGVMIMAEALHFSSKHDKNPVLASSPYYGVIEEIWELDYTKFKMAVFRCKWVNRSNVHIDDLGFTLVDLNHSRFTDEPFILAIHAKQVFYVKDPSSTCLSVVLQRRSMHEIDENMESLDINETPSFSMQRPIFTDDVDRDDVYATRDDHEEGIDAD